jgi:hypothetical protein
MKRINYLSIDLDYFNGCDPDFVGATLDCILRSVQKQRLPLIAVMNHQQMLPHIDQHPAEILWNFDQHVDLAPLSINRLDCGSWVAYVRWRKKAAYIWVRNSFDPRHGMCGGADCFADEGCSDWGALQSIPSVEAPGWTDLLARSVAVGICLSPAYADPELEAPLRAVLARYGVSMKKGRREEDHERRIRPPGVR